MIKNLLAKLKKLAEYEQLEKEKRVLILPVPLGTTLYRINSTCGDFCTFDKKLFDETVRCNKDTLFDGCRHNLPCHTRMLVKPDKFNFELNNYDYVRSRFGTFVFKTEKEAEFSTKALIMKNRADMEKLGFKLDENGYAITKELAEAE